MKFRRWVPLGLLAVLWGMFLPISSAKGITINLRFNSSSSSNPTYDSDGSKLYSIMTAAKTYWEDILEDEDYTITINYYWKELDSLSSDTLAVHTAYGLDSYGRENVGRILFDTASYGSDWPWYIDETPLDSSEFNMKQSLYGDLSSSAQSGGFNGEVPSLLETGYQGKAISSDLTSTIDLFSVALHEMGHALGLNELSTSETSDGDYDVDADFVYGDTMAINTYSSSNKDHIYDANALMNPYTHFGRRTLPSAEDVFAMASAAGWTTIDLPRKDAWGGGDWNTSNNWEGNRLPDNGDEVWVRHGETTTLSDAGEAGKLVIDKASTVDTGAYTLSVSDTAQITGGSKLIVGSGGTFSAKYLTVINASTLQLAGGTVAGNAEDSLLTISEASAMTGNGTLNLDVKNNGTLSHDGSVGTITINGDFTQSSTGSLTVDIGGTNAGINSDLLSISGQADLGGKLEIDLLSAYTPSVGDTITILTYGSHVGEFDTLSDWIIGDGLYFATDYETNSLNLVTTHAIDGDVNYDGLANSDDLAIMAASYNKTSGTAGWEMADFNGDGYVNWDDLVLLAANYSNGDGTIGIDPALLAASVPEPATLGLLILGMSWIHSRRRN